MYERLSIKALFVIASIRLWYMRNLICWFKQTLINLSKLYPIWYCLVSEYDIWSSVALSLGRLVLNSFSLGWWCHPLLQDISFHVELLGLVHSQACSSTYITLKPTICYTPTNHNPSTFHWHHHCHQTLLLLPSLTSASWCYQVSTILQRRLLRSLVAISFLLWGA